MRKKLIEILVLSLLVLGFNGIGHASLNDGLVAYYPFNGNANDESGNGNHGTNYGAAPTPDRNSNPNSAFNFDGVNDYIDINKIASQLKGVGTGSISIWFKTDEKVKSKILLSYHKDESYISGYIVLGHYTNYISNESIGGVIVPSIGDSGGVGFGYLNGNDYYMDGKWHHAVFVMGTNYNALYMDCNKVSLTYFNNGSRITGNSSSGNIMWSEIAGVLIGKSVGTANTGYNYKGSIDDLRIYNRALSEAEIKELCNDDPDPDCYTEGYAAGQAACKANPASCGIIVTGGDAVTLTPDLKMHLPNIQYTSILGIMSIWADLAYDATKTDGTYFKVTGAGAN